MLICPCLSLPRPTAHTACPYHLIAFFPTRPGPLAHQPEPPARASQPVFVFAISLYTTRCFRGVRLAGGYSTGAFFLAFEQKSIC